MKADVSRLLTLNVPVVMISVAFTSWLIPGTDSSPVVLTSTSSVSSCGSFSRFVMEPICFRLVVTTVISQSSRTGGARSFDQRSISLSSWPDVMNVRKPP